MTQTMKRIAIVAVVAVLIGAVVAVVIGKEDADTLHMTAYFADVQPLRDGNEVKAGGVKVGSIDAVSLENGRAKVDMTIDRTILPLHADASGRITQQDLLGERYIELNRGTPTAPPMPEPYSIPVERTSRGTDLQEILNSVDEPTSTALAAMLTTTGEGLNGRGADAAGAIAALSPAMNQTGRLAGVLNDQNQVLRSLVDRARPVAQALATEDGRRLDGLVGSTSDTLGAVGDREAKLRETIQALPGTLASARRTLAGVAGVADPAARTLEALRPTTDDLRDISKELKDFTDAADPALASLPPVLERGRELLDELGPVAKDLRPVGENLKDAAPQARTISDVALNNKIGTLMEFVKGWSLATSDYDAVSHYFKATVVATPKAAGQTGLVPKSVQPLLSNLPVPQALGTTPGPATQKGPPTFSPPNAPNAARTGATGLRPNQETGMVDQLLGGN